MPYPPVTIAANKSNNTSESDDHPNHHNELATAVNDIVERLNDLIAEVSGLTGGTVSPDLGSTYFIPASALTLNSEGAAAANRAVIQAVLDANTTVHLPAGTIYVDDSAIGPCLYLNAGNRLIGAGKDMTTLIAASGSNHSAVVATKLWANGTGQTHVEGLGCAVQGLTVDGNWKHPTTGAVRNSGTGHGIALCGYKVTVEHVLVQLTSGYGIMIDTSDDTGTAKGESIENAVIRCETRFTGKCGIYAADTGAFSNGGCTDSRIESCDIVCWNTSNDTDEADAAGIYIDTAGGWYVHGQHLYGNSALPAQYSGYGSSHQGHGIYARNCYGTRIEANQVADFGYSATDPGDGWSGIIMTGYANRGYYLTDNVIWHDKSRRLGTVTTRAIRVNTLGGATGENVSAQVSNNVWHQRDSTQTNDEPVGATLRGIKVVNTSAGNYGALAIVGNVAGVDSVTPFEATAAALPIITMVGNSWQTGAKLTVTLNTGTLTNTDMPSAERGLNNSTRFATPVNLSGYKEVRLSVRVSTQGAAGSKVILKYMTAFTTTVASWLTIGTSAVEASLAAAGVASSAWVPLAAGAQADVIIIPSESGGDAAADPVLGMVVAEFR